MRDPFFAFAAPSFEIGQFMKTNGLFLAVLVCALAGSVTADTSPPKILAAWTQFVAHASSGKPVGSVQAPSVQVRFVAEKASSCDDFGLAFELSDNSKGMADGLETRRNPNTSDFPITVCTLDLKPDWKTVRIIAIGGDKNSPALPIDGDASATATLPGPHQIGRRHSVIKNGVTIGPEIRTVTIGDTGCRNTSQNCDGTDPSKRPWPFASVADSAAKEDPDLVVHAGDYRYYGGHGSAGAQSWEYWNLDLFRPARKLLLTAPWVFARGNHERCQSFEGSAGPGFFYLLGPDPDPTMTSCSDDGSPTWIVDVAAGGFAENMPATDVHRMVVIDTNWNRSPKLAAHFAQAVALSTPASTWWVTHVPVIDRLQFGNQTGDRNAKGQLNAALLPKGGGAAHNLCDLTRVGIPSCRPSTMVMSHDHMLQTVTFQDDAGLYTFPQAYIVGHGGVALRGAGLRGSPCFTKFNLPNGYMNDTVKPKGFGELDGIVRVKRQHGYVVWSRSSETFTSQNGWVPAPKDAGGADMVLVRHRGDIPLKASSLTKCLARRF